MHAISITVLKDKGGERGLKLTSGVVVDEWWNWVHCSELRMKRERKENLDLKLREERGKMLEMKKGKEKMFGKLGFVFLHGWRCYYVEDLIILSWLK